MIDDEKVKRIKEQMRKTIKGNPMYIKNEPKHSGDPKNTISKDLEEERAFDERPELHKK